MEIELLQFAGLVIVGAFASALNAVAGGGSFFVFPILIFMGLGPSLANVTNKVGMWCGATASIFGYKEEIRDHKRSIASLALIGVVGSIAGSLLLLITPPERFAAMVPFLMGSATLLFAYGQRIICFFSSGAQDALPTLAGWVGQFLIGLYAGFFGAGMGIMMMALYELMGIKNIHEMNGIKVSVASAMLTVSAITFILLTPIHWPHAIALIIGTMIGGYYGASLARRLPGALVRSFVILYGITVTLYFSLFQT